MLLLVLHHIAGDGWSLGPLWRDLAAFYRARVAGGVAALPALSVQYADYTLWQRQALGEESNPDSAVSRQLAYWKEALRDLPEQIELPCDRGRPAVSSHRGGSVPLELSGELHGGLLALGRSTGASLFMVLQAGLVALLSRLGAGTDIALGSPIAGRTDAALEELVGFFVNTLVLRSDVSGNPQFAELIGRVRAGDLAAYAHQDVPFERLVEVLNPSRSLSRHPLFQVMLAFENAGAGAAELAGLALSAEPLGERGCEVRPVGCARRAAWCGRRAAGIAGVIEYSATCSTAARRRPSASGWCGCSASAVAEASRPVGELAVLSGSERSTILAGWNDDGAAGCGQPPCRRCLRRRPPARRMRSRCCSRSGG